MKHLDNTKGVGDTVERLEDYFCYEWCCEGIEDKFKQAIEAELLRARIDELKNLQALHTRTYHQKVTDNMGDIYVDETHAYISKYETQERISELETTLKKIGSE